MPLSSLLCELWRRKATSLVRTTTFEERAHLLHDVCNLVGAQLWKNREGHRLSCRGFRLWKAPRSIPEVREAWLCVWRCRIVHLGADSIVREERAQPIPRSAVHADDVLIEC